MGYDDIYIEFKCDGCGTLLRWAPEKLWKAGQRVGCPKCYGTSWERFREPHYIYMPEPPLPNVRSVLYIGPEKLKRIKLIPLPKNQLVVSDWGSTLGDLVSSSIPEEIQPYSIRSFLVQLSLRDGFPCKYYSRVEGRDAWGNIHWRDSCIDSCSDEYHPDNYHPCHLANGWMHGEESCAGWEYITRNLCQSENEARFLHQYLRINKDRESPMPIPQAHIEITEKVRVDFVMFVPITRFDWKWLAIEIDSQMYHEDEEKEFERSMTIASQGYEVLRLSAEQKMLDQVRKLYQRVCNIQNAGKEKVSRIRKTPYTDLSQ